MNDVSLIEEEFIKQEQVDCPVVHRFGPGIYIREVSIPANTFSIGHHQNFEHTNIMLKGKVKMLNDDGSVSELCAPLIYVGKPGRKIGYIIEDMVWQNIYAETERDIEKLEKKYLTKSDTWIQSMEAKTKLIQFSKSSSKNDYLYMLEKIGFTEDQVKKQSFEESDMTDLPYGGYKIMVSKSFIDGSGLFATANIVSGEVIAPARINGKRTIAGRYTNHSNTPNAKMVFLGNDINLVAIENILGCKGGELGEEITVNYEDVISLRKNEVLVCQE